MKLAFCAALLVLGLAVTTACVSNDELSGCQKDDDCAEGRICEDGECSWVSVGGGGSGGSGGSSTGCVETGESCSVNADCCNFEQADGYCVSGTCADACATDVECASGCCALLGGGGYACAPASICSQVCVDAGQSCSVNADCCNFRADEGFCVDGTCADKCTSEADCISNCCAELQGGGMACAPIEVCL